MDTVEKNHRALLGLAVLLILISVASFLFVGFFKNDGILRVYFLDVGQGDAMLIVTPERKQILIDGGPDRSVLSQLSSVMPFYDRSIDVIISTHPDADHLNGLIDVIDRYKIDNIIETGVFCDSAQCDIWKDKVKKENTNRVIAYAGYKIYFDGGYIDIISPQTSVYGVNFPQRNDTSIVAKLYYGNNSVLFTGDIEAPIEKRLIYLADDLKSDFLKIPHHGSRTSSTEEFLKKVDPKLVFIEVGKNNSYNHPHPEILTRLANLSIPYYRTDVQGRIELKLDGENYVITKQKK